MKPRPKTDSSDPGDLFRAELASIINPAHELVRLADRIAWDEVVVPDKSKMIRFS